MPIIIKTLTNNKHEIFSDVHAVNVYSGMIIASIYYVHQNARH